MEAKSSSSSTRAAASRATSVPRAPIAMPISAALQRGGVVHAVAGHRDHFAVGLERVDDQRSFCSGTMRANTLTVRIRRASSSSAMAESSGPVMTPAPLSSPISRAIASAVPG